MEQVSLSPDGLLERLFGAALGVFDLSSVFIGDRLGFYGVLADHESLTAAELAATAGTNERYTREWLEQQGATGILTCANPEAAPGERRFALPAEYRELFVDPESLSGVAPMAQIVMGAIEPLTRLIEVFRQGGGISFGDFGPDLAEGQARFNRPMFRHQLAQDWVASMPDIVERFAANPPARVADIGMGYGWSSIYLAKAFPNVLVDGYDLDEASVLRAQALAVDEQVGDRVRFHYRDAGDPELSGTYNFAMAIECVHDMSDPVSVLSSMRRLVGPGGTVLVVDELAPDTYSAPGSDLDRYFYGFSVLHCLPAGMADEPSVETGTVIREATMRDFAAQAGFSAVDVLPVEHDFFRFYRMTP